MSNESKNIHNVKMCVHYYWASNIEDHQKLIFPGIIDYIHRNIHYSNGNIS